jgi:chaperone required for assembly of F1-ATPase
MTKAPREIVFSVGTVAGAGFAVLGSGRPLRTPRGHELVVPTQGLAEAIREELTAEPGVLAGRGLNDPAMAPNFRIAAGAIDVIAADAAARAQLEKALAGYGTTDLVCYRSPRPDALVAREAEAWDPLCAWFEDRFGVRLAQTTGFEAVPCDARLEDILAAALAALDPFRLAAVSLAVHAAGSIVIGLALAEGRLDPEAAFAAAVVGELFQEETWGMDKEAVAARAVKRLDLEQAARFLALLD